MNKHELEPRKELECAFKASANGGSSFVFVSLIRNPSPWMRGCLFAT